MKKIVLVSLLTLGTSTLLAGCGLIPPIALGNDPLALDGKPMQVTLAAVSAPNVSTRVAGVGTAQLNATFPDYTSISIPLSPSEVDISLALKSAQISADCLAATGQTVAVTLSNFTLKLSDGTGAALRSFSLSLPEVNFSVNTSNGTISNLAVDALKYTITNVQTVTQIITTTPSPNAVDVSGTVSTNPALPGCTLTFILGPSSGIVKL
jgi:hypothetical protein